MVPLRVAHMTHMAHMTQHMPCSCRLAPPVPGPCTPLLMPALPLLLILPMLAPHLLALTLSPQVADRAFSSPHDFRENLGLIWHNAVLYNGPDHLVAKHANELKVCWGGGHSACPL